MKQVLTFILVLLIASVHVQARYELYKFEGDITVKHANRQVEPEIGMELNASDQIFIPQGGLVEIYNTVTKEIFTSVNDGQKSVMGIMLEARKQSEKTTSVINERMRFAANAQQDGTRLYTDGLVKRSMEMYDLEAQNLSVEPEVLALQIVKAVNVDSAAAEFPTMLIHDRMGESGLEFKIENTLSSPVYVNVIKINETQLDSIGISELGQPMGCYVIFPGQSLSRQHFAGLSSTDSHYLIMTYCHFDIDELISQVNAILSQQKEEKSITDSQRPVYIVSL